MNKLILTFASITVFGTAAFACFDRDARPLNAAQIQYLSEHTNSTFSACLNQLGALGIDLQNVTGLRKDQPAGNGNQVAYTIMVEGNDSEGLSTRIYINWDLTKNAFVCDEPTHAIPKCM